ncbi:hypothetical protein COJ96_02165 [Bacillus sp. AFS073361]|uniref:flagellar protein FlgN n=1 Tax=Bacillus sp. AFS073361 TaxID=2033511 RepID=UPI000BFA202F|nr:flagellar protein FlgN [Bacillus sp. AFS073361]PFP30790.1 hypothetical protein COJ96_02165 [Bacillus sp. AFS073361]
MEALKKLKQTMETMVDAHTRLLDLAKKKRTILVEGNNKELQSLIYRESSCADEIQKLEQERKRYVQEYLLHKGFSGHSFTLEELMKIQDDPTSKTSILFIAKQLRVLIQEITNLNENNQQLIETSLSYLQYSIGMHVRKEPAIGYGPKAGNRFANLLDAKI